MSVLFFEFPPDLSEILDFFADVTPLGLAMAV
ncbi:MAG: hypothetical protein ACI9CB_002806 [Rhodothermales bacterium]|jgi:hypothetical protein